MHIEEDVQRLLSQIQPAGCLQDHLAGFATQLIENNYSVLSARDYARSTAHLGRWMEVVGVEIDELSEELIAKFGRHQCACPRVWRHGQRPSQRCITRVQRFVMYLRDRRVVAAGPAPIPQEIPAAACRLSRLAELPSRARRAHHRSVRGSRCEHATRAWE